MKNIQNSKTVFLLNSIKNFMVQILTKEMEKDRIENPVGTDEIDVYVYKNTKEEDIPVLVKNFVVAKGENTGGFVNLTPKDVTEIYKIAAHASV